MNVYAQKDYRRLIKDCVEASKEEGAKLTFNDLASAARMQRSYLSQVLHGRAELNADQLYLICAKLGLNLEQCDYAQLLLDIERCQIPKRKSELLKKRDSLRNSQLTADQFLQDDNLSSSNTLVAEYYMDTYIPLVHMFLLIPIFRRSPELIKSRLGIHDLKLKQCLRILEELQIIKIVNGVIKINKNNLHTSAGTALADAHAKNCRLLAIEHKTKRADEKDYFFTATFAATEDVRDEIRLMMLNLIKAMDKRIDAAPSQEVFQVNLDLFKV